ncbi:MAG: histidine kinase [Bryobacteraceae bacterium]
MDRRIRLIFTPIVGLAISHATGLYGNLRPASSQYWIASAYFILVSVVIWQGNHWFWMRCRGYADWLRAPKRRLMLLVSSSVLFTVPVSFGMLWAWQAWLAGPVDWAVIRSATLLCVMTDLFIKNTYETAWLVRQRGRDQVEVEQLERAKVQAELAALKSQIDPHFLFNCLNTLAGLIEEDPERASGFTVTLADVYRYILRNRSRELVPLREEVAFLRKYYSLLRWRFDDALSLEIRVDPMDLEHYWIPPVSLQLLLENAVKHNDFSAKQPLVAQLRSADGMLVFSNNKQEARRPAAATKLGLANLDERCRLVLRQGIEVVNSEATFAVKLPLGTEPVPAMVA